MIYAWASDPNLRKRGESGGAITALLKFALEAGIVDAVLGVRRGLDLYDARPVLITDPQDVEETAGSIHGGTLLMSKLFGKYLGGAEGFKVAAVMKGCDVMGTIEQAKRGMVDIDNLLLIGLNCGGSIAPSMMRRMICEVFDVDPRTVEKETIHKGKFHITVGGEHRAVRIKELEEGGYGRRDNCRRCKMKVPRGADLACGNWGVREELVGEATFVEVCSERGRDLVERATAAGAIGVGVPEGPCIKARKRREDLIVNLSDEEQKRDFALQEGSRDRIKFIVEETACCIKCYACVEVCPALFNTTGPYMTAFPGIVPPGIEFHLTRYAHIADSCINCGQCEELCPMDIPNARIMHAIATDLQELYGYKAGEDMSRPKISLMKDPKTALPSPSAEDLLQLGKG
jgi:formate dehydrogenase subunit beta